MPPTPSRALRGVFEATVSANEPICREHHRLRLRLPAFPPTAPGQFVQLQCRPVGERPGAIATEATDDGRPTLSQPELVAPEAMLRRPFSLAGRTDRSDGVELEIIHRVVGVGTGWLAGLKKRQCISVLGPLGNSFPLPPDGSTAALIGGGVGIPPMLYLAEALQHAGMRTVAFCGATSADLLPLSPGPEPILTAPRPNFCCQEFYERGTGAVLTTDDGTLGATGRVTDAFDAWLREAADPPVVYACGPEPMMRAAAECCAARGATCYVSAERQMACGMGTCQSCIVKVRDASSDEGWSYKLCCKDGPVFDATDLLW